MGNTSIEAVVRSIIRVSIVGIPALLYIRFYEKKRIKDYINKNNLEVALKWGLLGSIIIFLFFLFSTHFTNFKFPLDFPAWMNWIIGSPLTEELYFRCIVLKELLKRYNPLVSVIVSSSLFLAFHMPQWIFTMHVGEIIIPALTIFAYGLGFSFLWIKTKSIFGALLPHSLNNFLYMATSLVR
ncbi:MAG: CPBP family intramembrane glutamic endopeptidase [Patescibacteria group bacterium]